MADESISVICPHCLQSMRVKKKSASCSGPCVSCGETIVIPSREQLEENVVLVALTKKAVRPSKKKTIRKQSSLVGRLLTPPLVMRTLSCLTMALGVIQCFRGHHAGVILLYGGVMLSLAVFLVGYYDRHRFLYETTVCAIWLGLIFMSIIVFFDRVEYDPATGHALHPPGYNSMLNDYIRDHLQGVAPAFKHLVATVRFGIITYIICFFLNGIAHMFYGMRSQHSNDFGNGFSAGASAGCLTASGLALPVVLAGAVYAISISLTSIITKLLEE
ncbi:MAG TPA: hypothetical protein PLD73_17965 [Candidatus Hydrogenedentes bacterium]|nr:hypothetical protein [Candidatus Hydrogenedentota bacterium]